MEKFRRFCVIILLSLVPVVLTCDDDKDDKSEHASYTITYNANDATGGSVPSDSTGYQLNQAATILGNTGDLEKTGSAYYGWNTLANGGGTTYLEGQTMTVSGNITLFAKWLLNDTDYDADGYTGNDGDLDETNALVNPGAYEIIGNGLDDDCDSSTPDTAAVDDGFESAVFTGVTPLQAAQAIGLYRTTTDDPPISEKTWGVIDAEFLTSDGVTPVVARLTNMSDYQAAIMTDYGTGGVVPRSGAAMVGISTGRMRDASDTGYEAPVNGRDFGYIDALPGDYDFPGTSGCSGSCSIVSSVHDSVNIRLTMRVPTNARGFAYDHIFFTGDFNDPQCSYTDYSLALLTSGASGIPEDRNIAFDTLGEPLSVNSGFLSYCTPTTTSCGDCSSGADILAGTGMDTDDVGGSTGWLTTKTPVIPGETIVLEIMIFDSGDGLINSVLLLDNFRWLPGETTVSTVPAD